MKECPAVRPSRNRYVARRARPKGRAILVKLKLTECLPTNASDRDVMERVGPRTPILKLFLNSGTSIHNELNRESQYFESVIWLSDLYCPRECS